MSVATADRRTIIPVAGTDPYAWMGIEDSPDNVWLRTCKATEERKAERERTESAPAKV